ncbi:DNA-methyltransferase [Rossellomorea marisflavi]|uniref:DNA-methyltransferase n=1 Tax=Rossellomorea marisflavi TaxID=189381 RepID=UPI003FA17B7F
MTQMIDEMEHMTLNLNTVHQMDCIEGMKKIPDASIDLILCDLPYGQTSNKWDTPINMEELWEGYKRILKDNGVVLLTAKGQFMIDLILSNREWFRYEWIWDKNKGANFAHVRYRPLNTHEYVLVFSPKGRPTYNPQMTEGKPYTQKRLQQSIKGIADNMGRYTTKSDGKRYPKSVLRVEGMAQRHIIHPTQKPLSLFEYLVKTYSNPGDVVLDTCMGSGTTAVACERNERSWIGFEIEDDYVKLTQSRIEKMREEKKPHMV